VVVDDSSGSSVVVMVGRKKCGNGCHAFGYHKWLGHVTQSPKFSLSPNSYCTDDYTTQISIFLRDTWVNLRLPRCPEHTWVSTKIKLA